MNLSYKKSGVDIDTANDTKKAMAGLLVSDNARLLNKVGAFATLFDGYFPDYKHPVLVLKTEEPGSKQKLAFEQGSIDTICQDLVNHLVNDAIVTGAKPLSIQDCIVCGTLEKDTVLKIVEGMSQAAKANGAILTGGETSEQPGVVEAGTYILTASIVGVVEKDRIIDGSKIQKGDVVIALASSGVHTNGYSLVRKIMEGSPAIMQEKVAGKDFVQALLTPHRAYYATLRDLFENDALVGLAHITGGGIKENLNRILPKTLNATVDLGAIRILPIFKVLKQFGGLDDNDMLRTFNLGIGVCAVVRKEFADEAIAHVKTNGVEAYIIGSIGEGGGEVSCINALRWS